MEIKVRIKDVYGIPTIYPVCSAAMAFSRIAKTKTLTQATLAEIDHLGYEINVVPEEMESVIKSLNKKEDTE